MSMHVRPSRYNGQEYQIKQARTTSTTSLSIRTIIVIGVCGGLGLFAVLLLILFFVKRGKQRTENRKVSSGELDEAEEVRRAIRSTRPPDIDLGRRKSYLSFLSKKKKSASNAWADEDELHGPQMGNNMTFGPGGEIGASHNGYPLVTLINPPGISNSQVAIPRGPFSPSDSYPVISPPGTLAVPPPSFANGQSRNPALGDWNMAMSGVTYNTIQPVSHEPQKLSTKRRSASDTHLGYILRSTSQRLRDRRASQRPLSRAHSVLSQFSGAPPSQRLPPPSRNNFGERGYGDSREGLIDTREMWRPGSEYSYDTLNYETILDDFPTRRTPSPSKPFPWSPDHVTGKCSSSPSAATDEDSLCNGRTPDSVIPFHLTSPSKRRSSNVRAINSDEHQPVHIHSEEEGDTKSAIETPTRVRKDSNARIQEFGYFDLAAQQRRRVTKSKDPESGNDPFYSGFVKSGRSATRVTQSLIGPRSPLVKFHAPESGHSRKASTMPGSLQFPGPSSASETTLPLDGISRNSSQKSPNKSHDRSQNGSKLDVLANYQWSPERMHQVARKTSVSSIGPSVSRQHYQGHKRQNVIRISGLPRPRSVCPVPEESEDLNDDDVFSTSGLDLSNVPSVPPPLLRLYSTESLAKSASLASIYSRYSMTDNVQPPSSIFEPRLTLVPSNGNTVRESVSMNSMGSSPTLGAYHQNLNPSAQTSYGHAYPSPSRSAYNRGNLTLTEETEEITDDFGSPLQTTRISKGKTKGMGRNFFIDCGTVTAEGPMFAFPQPPTPTASSHAISDPFSHAHSSSSARNPTMMPAAYSEPVPSLLSRLYSPHSPHRFPNSSDFLLKNITQLRRGNSTLSSYSMNSMGSTLTIGLGEKDDSNHTLADLRGGGSEQGAEYINGNKNYLNLSNPNPQSSSPTKQAKSTPIHSTTQTLQNSQNPGGRSFPLISRSNNMSPFQSAAFEELGKGSAVGLGINVPTFNSQQTDAKNESSVFESIQKQLDMPSSTRPSRKFKSVRKSAKSRSQHDSKHTTSDLTSSPPALNSEKESWSQGSKQRSFKFKNYSSLHFENSKNFRFTTASLDDDDDDDDEDDDEIFGEDDKIVISQEERESDYSKGFRQVTTGKAISAIPQFQFQGIQKFVSDQHMLSRPSASFSHVASTAGLNVAQQRPAYISNELNPGWKLYPQSKHTLAPPPSIETATTPSISPIQPSYTQIDIQNTPANQSTAQLDSAPITHTNKSTEIHSPVPIPASSSRSQILQNKHQEQGILQLDYPKTSRWVWEETAPKVSPSPSPDRQAGSVPERKMYKAHSRNQSSNQTHQTKEDNAAERRMGDLLSSNPTVSSLIMAMELGIKEPRTINLDEATNFTLPHPRILNIENLDPEALHKVGKVSMQGTDITQAAITTNLNHNSKPSTPTAPSPTSRPNCVPAISEDLTTSCQKSDSEVQDNPTASIESQSIESDELGKSKRSSDAKGKAKTKARSHLENMFSRHHKGHVQQQQLHGVKEGVITQNNRGSLYDQDGFLKSSPARTPTVTDGARTSRWGVKGK